MIDLLMHDSFFALAAVGAALLVASGTAYIALWFIGRW